MKDGDSPGRAVSFFDEDFFVFAEMLTDQTNPEYRADCIKMLSEYAKEYSRVFSKGTGEERDTINEQIQSFTSEKRQVWLDFCAEFFASTDSGEHADSLSALQESASMCKCAHPS